MKNPLIFILCTLALFTIAACKQKGDNKRNITPHVSVRTVAISRGNIEKYLHLNGTTIYLKEDKINSPISGYVIESFVGYGERIHKNDLLFALQTKESRVLNNKQGIVRILAHSDGIVSEMIAHRKGDFLVEGNLLCTIVNDRDLTIQANVPFEYNAVVKQGSDCKILLSDNSNISGRVTQILPLVNSIDQTQTILIQPNTSRLLPKNLNLIVLFKFIEHKHSLLIPKEALMTNEMQNKFWVMKILHDSIAIKVPVIKGIENDSLVEITSEGLDTNNIVITQGAYGLPDGTIVKITK